MISFRYTCRQNKRNNPLNDGKVDEIFLNYMLTFETQKDNLTKFWMEDEEVWDDEEEKNIDELETEEEIGLDDDYDDFEIE